MNRSFLLYRRGQTYYCQNTQTGKQESLRTKDKAAALRLMHSRNEAQTQPAINLQIARVYLQADDPTVSTRTWQVAMDELTKLKLGETQARHISAMRDPAFDLIRNRLILETQAEHFLRVLQKGRVSTNVYLRRLHNFALDMNWLPWPVLPKKRWPAPAYKAKRAICWEEHQAIVAREPNDETRSFYQLLWHLGGSQSDVASLRAEDIDWEDRLMSYQRQKTGTTAALRFGDVAADLLKQLPKEGYLFPRLAKMHEKHRAKEFRRRTLGLGIRGVTMHSYRYAWAERAKQCGYPERFAQEALGHSSKAVHRAYARRASMELPPLEDYEAARAKLKAGQPTVVTCEPRSAGGVG